MVNRHGLNLIVNTEDLRIKAKKQFDKLKNRLDSDKSFSSCDIVHQVTYNGFEEGGVLKIEFTAQLVSKFKEPIEIYSRKFTGENTQTFRKYVLESVVNDLRLIDLSIYKSLVKADDIKADEKIFDLVKKFTNVDKLGILDDYVSINSVNFDDSMISVFYGEKPVGTYTNIEENYEIIAKKIKEDLVDSDRVYVVFESDFTNAVYYKGNKIGAKNLHIDYNCSRDDESEKKWYRQGMLDGEEFIVKKKEDGTISKLYSATYTTVDSSDDILSKPYDVAGIVVESVIDNLSSYPIIITPFGVEYFEQGNEYMYDLRHAENLDIKSYERLRDIFFNEKDKFIDKLETLFEYRRADKVSLALAEMAVVANSCIEVKEDKKDDIVVSSSFNNKCSVADICEILDGSSNIEPEQFQDESMLVFRGINSRNKTISFSDTANNSESYTGYSFDINEKFLNNKSEAVTWGDYKDISTKYFNALVEAFKDMIKWNDR